MQAPGWMHMLGLDTVLRRAAVDRLLAQSHIARIRGGEIAHHAPAAPVLFDASPDALANLTHLTRAFPRADMRAAPAPQSAHLGFATFGLDRSAEAFAACLCPGGAFAVLATHDLSPLMAELRQAGLTVTARRHWGGLGHSLAGVKPVAAGHDPA